MKGKVVDLNGAAVREIELAEEVFGLESPSKSAIYEAIKNELANLRQGTSSTKTKAEVSGTGKKPWKQKGTGRASFGTSRNPVWVHGGIAFGPKPRDFSYKIPKKVKNLAYRSIFSLKGIANDLVILDQLESDGKTKDFRQKLEKVTGDAKVTVVLAASEKDALVKRAGKNLPNVTCLSYNMLTAHALYYSEKVVLTEETAKLLNDFLLKK